MKGVILAGGSGSRLRPLTRVVSKQLLPVYDKPMIYYPLSTLMLAGIREIMVITTPDDLDRFQGLLGDGSQWGLRIEYATQASPDGLPQGLIIAERFLAGAPSCLVLGDNVFFGTGLTPILASAATLTRGATVFTYPVKDPERYGVVQLAADGSVLSIEEKPQRALSRLAITGIYFFDGDAPAIARTLAPSARGELEITDLLREYLRRGTLSLQRLGRGVAWLDTGTHQSLLQASDFVRTIEERQGLKIACLEEIACRQGFITLDQLRAQIDTYRGSEYGEYLIRLAEEADWLAPVAPGQPNVV
ncbi:MAG TPA: glucose-1-phosphate thymidylyltransferase RfbA [Magnetospirillum sp.]|nr:glucose-1-phosphate thymidylyltransferase RfbA [Magnetospirillum sp.]